MKRIFILITKGEVGGAQMSVMSLASALRTKGHEVVVGFGEGTFLPTMLQEAHIPYKQFHHLRRSINPLKNFCFFLEFLHYLNRERFDVIHFNSSNALFGAIAAKWSRFKPKTVFTFRGLSLLDETYTKGVVRSLTIKLFRFLLRSIDVPVFVSDANARICRDLHLAERGVVIYNGLPLKTLIPFERDQARAWAEKITGQSFQDSRIIGSIGRLAYQKNYEFLIRIMPDILTHHPNVRCLIIGDGPKRAEYEAQIHSLGLEKHVFLLGSVDHAYRYATAFDVFVLPSRYEGMSITLIEMLTLGIPTIATDVGGNREELQDTALLYPLDDTKQFQAHLSMLLDSPKLRQEMSVRMQVRGQQFDIQETARQYLIHY